MGLLRKDPLDGHCVIIAENRAQRPNEFLQGQPRAGHGGRGVRLADCPFCVGNEAATPKSLFERVDSHGNWQVRVIANKFPALELLSGAEAEAAASGLDGDAGLATPTEMPAHGVQEVVVESPDHLHWTGDLTWEEFTGVLLTYRDRLRHWGRDPRVQSATFFKNVGPAAGATLSHLHGQLVAFPFLPPRVADELERLDGLAAAVGGCPICARIEEEKRSGARTVVTSGSWFVFCPFASRQPYETWVVPYNHASHFGETADHEIESLADVCHRLVIAIETVLPDTGYNIVLRTAPFDTLPGRLYHWVLEFIPRFTRFAGLEWGTAMHVNPVSPETAAQILKSANF